MDPSRITIPHPAGSLATPRLAAALGMLGVLAGAALPCAAPPAREDPAPAVTLALELPRTRWYVGETLELRCIVGVRAGLLEQGLVPLFRQPLELPFELVLPFADGTDCLVALPIDDAPPAAPTADWVGRLVLAGRDVWARALPSAHAAQADKSEELIERCELRVPFRVECPGTLVLSGARLRYALAESFRDDPISGRVPLDPQPGEALAPALALELARLPEAGRPPDFGGAIGNFEVEARAEPRDLTQGETLRLSVWVRGPGNLASFEPPRPAWPGFTLLGQTSTLAPGERLLTYDLRVERADLRQLPAFELPFFRPFEEAAPEASANQPTSHGELGYSRARTRPITLLVRPASVASSLESGKEPRTDPATPGGGGRVLAQAAAALAVVLALGLLLRRRRA